MQYNDQAMDMDGATPFAQQQEDAAFDDGQTDVTTANKSHRYTFRARVGCHLQRACGLLPQKVELQSFLCSRCSNHTHLLGCVHRSLQGNAALQTPTTSAKSWDEMDGELAAAVNEPDDDKASFTARTRYVAARLKACS